MDDLASMIDGSNTSQELHVNRHKNCELHVLSAGRRLHADLAMVAKCDIPPKSLGSSEAAVDRHKMEGKHGCLTRLTRDTRGSGVGTVMVLLVVVGSSCYYGTRNEEVETAWC